MSKLLLNLSWDVLLASITAKKINVKVDVNVFLRHFTTIFKVILKTLLDILISDYFSSWDKFSRDSLHLIILLTFWRPLISRIQDISKNPRYFQKSKIFPKIQDISKNPRYFQIVPQDMKCEATRVSDRFFIVSAPQADIADT